MLTKWLNSRETGWIPLAWESQRANAISLQQIQWGNIDLFHLKMKEQTKTGRIKVRQNRLPAVVHFSSGHARKIMQMTTVNVRMDCDRGLLALNRSLDPSRVKDSGQGIDLSRYK